MAYLFVFGDTKITVCQSGTKCFGRKLNRTNTVSQRKGLLSDKCNGFFVFDCR